LYFVEIYTFERKSIRKFIKNNKNLHDKTLSQSMKKLEKKHKMKKWIKINTLILLLLTFWSWNTIKKSSNEIADERQRVEIVTDYGTMIIELYNETPLHRDNFVKLVKEGTYDSLLFHRVIENFMIQGGDPDSRHAKAGDNLGEGDLPYKVEAEFNPTLFHKRGALGAARDGNLQRASSAVQFYIVQGKILNDSLLEVSEKRINGWLAEHFAKNDPTNKSLLDSIKKTSELQNEERNIFFNDSLKKVTANYTNYERYTIPESHRNVYKTIGGTPHLDQNYTVFGELIEGFEVLDSIAAVKTANGDRPITDVRILSARVLERD